MGFEGVRGGLHQITHACWPASLSWATLAVRGDRCGACHLLPGGGGGGLVWARAEFGGQFLGGGLAAQLLEEPALYYGDLGDARGRVDRDSGGPCLAGHGP